MLFLLAKDEFYSDITRYQTVRALNNLNVFNYPSIDYKETPDSTASNNKYKFITI